MAAWVVIGGQNVDNLPPAILRTHNPPLSGASALPTSYRSCSFAEQIGGGMQRAMNGRDRVFWMPSSRRERHCRYSNLPITHRPTARSTSADQAIEVFCQPRSCQLANFPRLGPLRGIGR
ncbi:hypothetical protein NOVOSPHI9U_620001 [Novosphingobium sp. 9U]|nr:hypothetical protein NOVOSPHI9U_620001 [Novosphingobium sp. 9U]